MTRPEFLTPARMSLPTFMDTIGAQTLAAVSRESGVSVRAIRGKSRVRHIAAARQEVCRRLRSRGWSYPRIGRFLGIDHTTAIYACGKVAA